MQSYSNNHRRTETFHALVVLDTAPQKLRYGYRKQYHHTHHESFYRKQVLPLMTLKTMEPNKSRSYYSNHRKI